MSESAVFGFLAASSSLFWALSKFSFANLNCSSAEMTASS